MRKIHFATLWNQGYEYVRISGGLSPPKAEGAVHLLQELIHVPRSTVLPDYVWFHGLVQPAVVFQRQQLNQLCQEPATAFFSSYEKVIHVSA